MINDTKDSTTGGALGTTHGSCLPGTVISHSERVNKSTDRCFLAMDEAGLNPIRITRGIPLVSPPIIPPELFVVVTIFPLETTYSSLFSDPFSLDPPNPEPMITASKNSFGEDMI